MSSGIYKITNTLNGHFYIGQSCNLDRRWYLHKNNATKVKKHYTILEKAFKKYGIGSFDFEVVEYCSLEQLNEREIYYIATLKPQYNMNSGGAGNTGHLCSESTKAALREKGKRQWEHYDEETRRKIIQTQLTGPRVGSHRSKETKELLSQKTKAYFQSTGGMPENQKLKISQSLRGKPRPNYGRYKQVRAIRNNETKYEFGSIKEASAILHIDGGSIVNCLKGNRKTAGGYSWEYCSQETIRKE